MPTVYVYTPTNAFVAKFKTHSHDRIKKDLQENRVQLGLENHCQVEVGKATYTVEVTDQEIILHSGSLQELKGKGKAPKATREGVSSSLVSCTDKLAGFMISKHLGICNSQVVYGLNFMRDIAISFRDSTRGPSKSIEQAIHNGREQAVKELRIKAKQMGANAIVGLTIDLQITKETGQEIIVTAQGNAVTANPEQPLTSE